MECWNCGGGRFWRLEGGYEDGYVGDCEVCGVPFFQEVVVEEEPIGVNDGGDREEE